MKRYIVEFVGTFFLVFTIAIAGQPLAIGFMLAALIFIGGPISDGHYNPAITLTDWLHGKIKLQVGIGYIIAQLLGGFAAAGLFNKLAQSTFSPMPLETVRMWEAILLEALFTFILCSVFLALKSIHDSRANIIPGIALGLTLASLIMTIGQVTGGAFNPAVGVGPILYNYYLAGGITLKNIIIYVAGPCTGSIIAVLFKNFLGNNQ